MKIVASAIMLSLVFTMIPSVLAEPTVSIVMEKTTFRYCEKLFYTIKVSEVTGQPAIIHLRDEAGKGSSAIPIGISGLETPVPSLVPFEAEVFPLGKYYIDVEYSGSKYTAEFELIDSENVCIPTMMKQIAYSWINNQISDGFFIDAIDKFVDKEIIRIPDKIKESDLNGIHIPTWVEKIVTWWLEEKISDDEVSNAIQNLLDRKIIMIV
ncbi:MAG: hypothetical protein K5793_06300 [Nitrosarchaeum sp.]|nr:hypothetical protein [Nitrosarchaeum sp.]MCV0398474.1 hypothetical protein [Nitrosarchaeum sp.]